MKTVIQKLKKFHLPNWSVPFFLLGLALLTYGLMLPFVGYFWDDLVFIWTYNTYGGAGIAEYLSTKRPVLAYLYQLTMPLVGENPLSWQIFGLVWRWLSAAAVWQLARVFWPKRKQLAVWIASLFIIYPGFTQQYIPIAYAHYFITFTFFVASLILNLLAVKADARWKMNLFTFLALLCSLINLTTTEYFYILDLLRAALLFFHFWQNGGKIKNTTARALKASLPYLILLALVSVWRLFFFEDQTHSYDLLFFEQLRAAPFSTVLKLFQTIVEDFYVVTLSAFKSVFIPPSAEQIGSTMWKRYWLVGGASLFILTVSAFILPKDPKTQSNRYPRQLLSALLIGVLALFLAGWPFWFTNLNVSLDFPNNRFTLPFILGASITLAALIELLPIPRWVRSTVMVLLLSASAAYHFNVSYQYRVEWERVQRTVWQWSWRMPQLEPDTILVGNYYSGMLYSDNSLTAPLNNTYAPDLQGESLPYLYIFPEVRAGRSFDSLHPDQEVSLDYLTARFNGNTSNSVAVFNYPPPETYCLRVLDPEIDAVNTLLYPELQAALSFSNWERIITDADTPARPPEAIFGAEPTGIWCHKYQKAALAHQQGDWQQVIDWLEAARAEGQGPVRPSEWLIFIEAEAMLEKYEQSFAYSDLAIHTKYMDEGAIAEMICRVYRRVDRSTPASEAKDAALYSADELLRCAQ
ncbi:MAG: hypothetical protein JW750_09420, partial [Anaerolineaceae bacterium]|nr:hypothetical protein [Anaerolineaceae bacterium]